MRTLLVSTKRDGFLRIVLRYDESKNEYVTHLYNEHDGGFHYGRYIPNIIYGGEDALHSFEKRCKEYSNPNLNIHIQLDIAETIAWQERDLDIKVNKVLAEQFGRQQEEFNEAHERASQFTEHAEPHHLFIG